MRNFVQIACLIVVSIAVSNPAQAQTAGGSRSARPLITQPIENTSLISLEGNARPDAPLSMKDLGSVAPEFALNHMLLQLKRSPEQETTLVHFMEEQNAKGSPNYHRWLGEAEFDETFGVNRSDVQKIVNWLESYGFKVHGVTPDGMLIDFSGTAAMVNEAFHTEIHTLQTKNGDKHFANAGNPKIPTALKDVVVGPVALNDFKPHSALQFRSQTSIGGGGQVHKTENGPKGDYTFSGCDGTCYAFTPGDAQTIYNINPLLTAGTTGKGQTIGLIEDSDDFTDTDWSTFMSTFGLTKYGGTLSTVHPAGSMTCTDPGDLNNGTDVEVALDIEYASATAPGANVVIESCADSNTAFGGLLAVENLASATVITTPILSISYDFCEALNGAANNSAYASAFQHAASRGISVFVAAGDDGSALCDGNEGYTYAEYGTNISGFASTPYNVAVGGTDFGDTYANNNSTYWSATNSPNYSSALSYIPEIPWNNSCASELIASAEGFSTTYGMAGFCNSELGATYFQTLASGSGGPSNCYSGAPALAGVGTSGTCKGQPKPGWQVVLGNPTDGVRDIPDVSLFAANGVWGHYIIMCISNTSESGGAPCTAGNPSAWTGVGGTSASSPMMAGIQALVNQSTGQMQGNPAPVYYSLAAQEYGASGSGPCNSSLGNGVNGACVFYDVTQGDMNTPCFYDDNSINNCYFGDAAGGQFYGVSSVSDNQYLPAYGTSIGWDFATGIGSVNAYNLVANWDKAKSLGTSIQLSATPQAVAEGGSVTLTANVMAVSGSASGAVTFKHGSVVVGRCTLVAQSCSYSASSAGISPGTYSITAAYAGNGEYLQSVSPTISVVIGAAGSIATTTMASATPGTVAEGNNIQFSAAVTSSSGVPSGVVHFAYGADILGSCTLNNGTCSFGGSSQGIQPSMYSVVAEYMGTAAYLPSTSAPVSVVIVSSAIPTATSLSAQPNPVAGGVPVTLTTTVTDSNGVASGKVQFTVGTSVFGSCTLADGTCTYSASSKGLTSGNYIVTANFLGSGNYLPSASIPLTIAVSNSSGITYGQLGLHGFTGPPDGDQPYGGPVLDSQGNVYGTTAAGGAHGAGTVYKVSPSGVETILFNFASEADGGYPEAGVLLDSAGNIFGTTTSGGSAFGVVFQLSPGGVEKILYNFNSTDGTPYGPLVEDASGVLYGVTQLGGKSSKGQVFSVNTNNGGESTLYSFTGGADGGEPNRTEGLILDSGGTNLYGTTMSGGYGFGTVFKVNTGTGAETVLYNFAGGNDGVTPAGGVALDTAGNIYGTTMIGGTFGYGTIYEVSASGTEQVLHSFTNGPDGGAPEAGVSLDKSGNLFGVTGNIYFDYYGVSGFGTVFKMNAQGLNTIFTFNDGPGGSSQPGGNLAIDSEGNLYGASLFTFLGGTNGLLYKLIPPQ